MTQDREIASTLRAAVHQKNIPGLDAMRALAIVMVILFHFKAPVSGALGVIIFFVLSGFLITGILLKEIAKSGTLSIRNFYVRRAYRIFPAFYVCWLLTMGVALWKHEPVTRSNALETFFYCANYGRAVLPLQQQYSYHMGISWSLAVEEQFYLLWPLALLWIHKLKNPVRAVTWIICALWAWRAVLVIGFHVSWDYAYNAFDTRADALMIGCWMALTVYRGSIPQSVQWWTKNKWLVLIPAGTLLALSTLDAQNLIGPSSQVFEFSFYPVLTGVLLLQWIYWGWPVLEHPIIKFIARLSYSLYLYHQLAHSLIPELIRIVPIHRGGSLLAALLFILVAVASYYGIERPFMKMRDRGHKTSVLMDDGIEQQPRNSSSA